MSILTDTIVEEVADNVLEEAPAHFPPTG